MQPLSATKFFVENKRRFIVIFIVLLLAIAVSSFITSLVTSIIKDVNIANLKPFEYCSIVNKTSDELFIKDKILDEVKSYEQIGKTIKVQTENTGYTALMGNTSALIFSISNQDELKLVIDRLHMTLSEGSIPQGDNYEIILHEKVLKNKNLKIGDYIGNQVNEEEWLRGKYKIVGSLKGESLIGFSNKSGIEQTYINAGISMDKPMVLLILPQEGKLAELNEQLSKIEKKDASVDTYTSIKRFIDSQIESMNILLQIVIFVVVLVMSISVSALIYIIYNSRSDEFGILYAMGYSKNFIKKLIFKELISLSSICWVLGYLLSMVMIFLLNLLLSQKGQSLYFFTLQGTMNTLIIPIFVTACAVFPIIKRFKKWDPISVIERRD